MEPFVFTPCSNLGPRVYRLKNNLIRNIIVLQAGLHTCAGVCVCVCVWGGVWVVGGGGGGGWGVCVVVGGGWGGGGGSDGAPPVL